MGKNPKKKNIHHGKKSVESIGAGTSKTSHNSLDSDSEMTSSTCDSKSDAAGSATGSSSHASKLTNSVIHSSTPATVRGTKALVEETPLVDNNDFETDENRKVILGKRQRNEFPDRTAKRSSRSASRSNFVPESRSDSLNMLEESKVPSKGAPKSREMLQARGVPKKVCRQLANVESLTDVAGSPSEVGGLMSTSLSPVTTSQEDSYSDSTDKEQVPILVNGSNKRKQHAQTANRKWQPPVRPIPEERKDKTATSSEVGQNAVDHHERLLSSNSNSPQSVSLIPTSTSISPRGTGIKTVSCSPLLNGSFSYVMSDDDTDRETVSMESIIEELDKDLDGKDAQTASSPCLNTGKAVSQNKDEDDLGHILKGVVAFVEVRSGRDDLSDATKEQVSKLGAKVASHFSRNVTHVIFKEGRKSTRDRALKFGTHLVSVLWVENCLQKKAKLPEHLFPIKVPSAFDSALQWKTRKPRPAKAANMGKDSTEGEKVKKLFSHIKAYYTDLPPDLLEVMASHPAMREEGFEKSVSSDSDSSKALDPDPLTESGLQRKGSCSQTDKPSSGEDRSNLGISSERLNVQSNKHIKSKSRNMSKPSKIKPKPKLPHSPDVDFLQTRVPDIAKEKGLQGKDTDQNNSEEGHTENRNLSKVDSSGLEQSRKEVFDKESEPKNPTKRKRKLYSGKENSILPIEHSATISKKQKDEKMPKKGLTWGPNRLSTQKGKLAVTPVAKKMRNSLDDFTPGKQRKKATSSTDDSDTTKESKSDQEESTSLDQKIQSFIPGLPKEIPPNSLVMTNIPPDQQDILSSIVYSLGKFHVRSTVGTNTTHVICGQPKRTLNILFGLARGCWILSPQWVFRSMEAEHWIEEEPFELHDYFPAVQISRLERAVAGPLYRQNLFNNLGPMYIADSTVPPADKLEKLVILCGGTVSSSYRRCSVAVGTMHRRPMHVNVSHVAEKWILDSVSCHEVLPFEDYSVK